MEEIEGRGSDLVGYDKADANGWQDIATAPRDGWFLIYDPEGEPKFHVAKRDGAYFCNDCDYLCSGTHWQPLPGAPAVGA